VPRTGDNPERRLTNSNNTDSSDPHAQLSGKQRDNPYQRALEWQQKEGKYTSYAEALKAGLPKAEPDIQAISSNTESMKEIPPPAGLDRTTSSSANWKDDVHKIGDFYRELLQQTTDATDPASLAQREADDAKKFFDCLFHDIDLKSISSILDIGCGPGNMIGYLRKRADTGSIGQYLGIDLLPEFIDKAKEDFRADNIHFLRGDFLEMPPETLGKKQMVLACGVLVHHVQNYEKYVERFIQHMLEVTSDIAAFNLITSVDADSENYDATPIIGKPRAIDKETLDGILGKLENCTVRCSDHRLFPDATDTFVQIRMKPA
jgi:SAM-dependent methyltransferase